MPHVNTAIFHNTLLFLDEQRKEGKLDAAVRLELLTRGFEEKLAELYEQCSGASVALAIWQNSSGLLPGLSTLCSNDVGCARQICEQI